MAQKIVQIDSFTDRPFSGNPAAICILKSPADEIWMQNVASEMDLSETAFLYPEGDSYNLRWFTPMAEVPLCGHATLAAAHLLWTDNHCSKDKNILFNTASGELKASQRDNRIELDFPSISVEKSDMETIVAEAIGVTPFATVANDFKALVEIESDVELAALTPDMAKVAALPVKGLIVTAKSTDSKYDFKSRFFAPALGINEDPVTGSAHCALAPYWGEKLNKKKMLAYQASKRGGEVGLRLENDRVILIGQAVIVFRGQFV